MNLTWESTFADGIFQTNGNNGFGSMLDIAGVNTARERNLAMLHNLSTEITNYIDRVLFTNHYYSSRPSLIDLDFELDANSLLSTLTVTGCG